MSNVDSEGIDKHSLSLKINSFKRMMGHILEFYESCFSSRAEGDDKSHLLARSTADPQILS